MTKRPFLFLGTAGVLATVLLLSCDGDPTNSSAQDRPQQDRPQQDRPEKKPLTLEQEMEWLRGQDLVFVGTVLRVGDPPYLMTGMAGVARQKVEYKVDKLLKGTLNLLLEKQYPMPITVRHAIINGPTADVPNNRLSRAVFVRGQSLLVGCVLDSIPEGWVTGLERGLYSLIDDHERTSPVKEGSVHFHGGAVAKIEDLEAAISENVR